jgi:hypothetical protein
MSSPISFYIPYVKYSHTEESIKSIFEYFEIGKVSRVDFEFLYNPDSELNIEKKMCFVHFEYFYSNSFAKFLQSILEQPDYYYALELNPTEFWKIYKCRNPIPNTHKNIHQLAEEMKKLENYLFEATKMIEKQAEEIEELKKMLLPKYQTKDFGEELEDDCSYSSIPSLISINSSEKSGNSRSSSSIEFRKMNSAELCGNN